MRLPNSRNRAYGAERPPTAAAEAAARRATEPAAEATSGRAAEPTTAR